MVQAEKPIYIQTIVAFLRSTEPDYYKIILQIDVESLTQQLILMEILGEFHFLAVSLLSFSICDR